MKAALPRTIVRLHLHAALLLAALCPAPLPAQSTAPPSAQIKSLQLTHNVPVQGGWGIRFQAEVTLSGVRGQKASALIYFGFPDGTPLRDFNGAYRTGDGEVAIGTALETRDERNTYKVDLSIPYGELHLVPGDFTVLAMMEVSHQSGGVRRLLAKSAGQSFHVTVPQPPPPQPTFVPSSPSPAVSNYDPMPQPNYRWAQGQRYTETALLELRAWFNRHPNAAGSWDFWREQTMRDIQNERDWISSRSSLGGEARRP